MKGARLKITNLERRNGELMKSVVDIKMQISLKKNKDKLTEQSLADAIRCDLLEVQPFPCRR